MPHKKLFIPMFYYLSEANTKIMGNIIAEMPTTKPIIRPASFLIVTGVFANVDVISSVVVSIIDCWVLLVGVVLMIDWVKLAAVVVVAREIFVQIPFMQIFHKINKKKNNIWKINEKERERGKGLPFQNHM